jgi:hypothetical protein
LLSEHKAKGSYILPGAFGDQHFDVLYSGHFFNRSMSIDGSALKVATAYTTTGTS